MAIALLLLLVTAGSAAQLHRINVVDKHVRTETIPTSCIRCILNVHSGCVQKGYRKDYCGINVITKDYWIKATKLPANGRAFDPIWMDMEYEKCVNNEDCVVQTIQSYLLKYRQVRYDCGAGVMHL